jgi:iron complex outermembrane receptor protein
VGAAYIDFETEIAHRFLVNVAARYEHYNDFGGNLAGKLAARYKLSERVALRGSVNNGFRAPSLPQRYYTVLNKNMVNVRGVLTPSIRALFRNESPQAQAFGIPNLTAERSLNVSGGMTAAISNTLRITVDAYWIQIRHRIVASGAFDTTSGLVKEILRPFPGVASAQFFVNAIHTRTKGLDLVFNGNWKVGGAYLLATLAGNVTQTRLFGDIKSAGKLAADSATTDVLFNREERGRLEHGQPRSKIIFSLNYKLEKFGILVRNTRFGETGTRFNMPELNPDENFSARVLTDFSLSYLPKVWLTITGGANNIFNVYPDRLKDPRNTQEGTFIYSLEASPFGFYGGHYFVSLGIHF